MNITTTKIKIDKVFSFLYLYSTGKISQATVLSALLPERRIFPKLQAPVLWYEDRSVLFSEQLDATELIGHE